MVFDFYRDITNFLFYLINRFIGSGALSGKILSVRIIENDKNDAYFRAG